MKALITGASSGLGYDMAYVLSNMGYDIVAVARREDRLNDLKEKLKTNVEVVCCDVTDIAQCAIIGDLAKDVDVFINNAGFGVFGNFDVTDLDTELRMLDTNVRAVHILTKIVYKTFKERGYGHILNVASLAAFFPGPMFGAYYATKSYVLRISQAVAEELRQAGSNVKISVLCPGPVHTEFSDVANVNFGNGTEKATNHIILTSIDVAEYAIKKMFAGKEIIIPGFIMKVAVFMRRILPDKILARAVYLIQSKKCIKKQ